MPAGGLAYTIKGSKTQESIANVWSEQLEEIGYRNAKVDIIHDAGSKTFDSSIL